MTSDIFQVDWITIDIVIIILLILLLICVKIIKDVYRWRFFFSDASIIKTVEYQDCKDQTSTIIIKKCVLTKSSVSQREDLIKPTIFLIRRYRKLMLLNALTEAFCSFGYNVLTVRLKSRNLNGTSRMVLEGGKELKHIFSTILKIFNQDIEMGNQFYNIIDFNKALLPYNLFLKGSNCRNLILINPHVKSSNLDVLRAFLNESNNYPKLITIFSEKLNPFFKNKKFKKVFLNSKPFKNTQHTYVQDAKSTFKYYETILFSLIIRYINEM